MSQAGLLNIDSSATVVNPAEGGTGLSSPAAHQLLITEGSSPMNLSGTGTAGQVFQSSGPGVDPAWSTATYPIGALTANDLLYASTTTAVSQLATGNNGVLITSAGGVPSIASTLPSAVQANITTTGTIGTGVWQGTPIALAYGGTNANLTASNGGIFYSTASAGAILAGTATANQVLLSGSSTTPAWSTATYPATTSVSQLLYSSSANVIGGLATANNAVLTTSSSGVPAITAISATNLVATNAAGTVASRAFSVNRQVFTSTGTYTPTTGMLYCDIEVVGGGGGGGGSAATGVATGAAGGPGAAGGYARGKFSAATIGASQSVTIGAGGTAGSAGNNAGGTGGTTSVGALISATGGGGGGGSSAGATQIGSGAAGGAGTGGDFQTTGSVSNPSMFLASAFVLISSPGAGSFFGGGAGGAVQGSAISSIGGSNGISYGGGASGGYCGTNGGAGGAAAAGGTGAKGVVIVTEYIIN